MRGLATGRQHSLPRTKPRRRRQSGIPGLRYLAPGSQLAAAPRLNPSHSAARVGFGGPQAIQLAKSLVSLGMADDNAWKQAGKDPLRMIQTSIDQFLEKHGKAVVAKNYELGLCLGQSVFDYGAYRCPEIDPALLFFALSPSSSFPVRMGTVVDELECFQRGLGAAAYKTLQNALYRWVRAYDEWDARQYIEMSMESVAEGEEDEYEIPKLDPDLPECLRGQKPLWPQKRCPRLSAYAPPADPRLRQIVEMVREIHRTSYSARRPDNAALLDELRQAYSLESALPVVVLHFREGDAISACFDFEAEYWCQETPEPNLVLPFHPDRPSEVKTCLKVLAVVTWLLALTVDLSRLLASKK